MAAAASPSTGDEPATGTLKRAAEEEQPGLPIPTNRKRKAEEEAPNQPIPRIPKRPPGEEAPRPRKRPGAGARIDKARSDAVLEKRKREDEAELRQRGGDEYVKQHYNLVPQRGREWRNTESGIKGLRKYNNWVKSVVINRFSQPDDRDAPPLRVLDIGCGKGGDLQKWRSAPHPVELYVGVDPAEVSIDQASERYAEMKRDGRHGGRGGRGGYRGRQQAPLYHAEFYAKDAFGQHIADIPIVQQVGFDAAGISRWGGGGFDAVSMMFCMHYAFESEAKARGMLANVAGSLKKGGRFIGVIPNSDIIRSKVEEYHAIRQRKNEHGHQDLAPRTSKRITRSPDPQQTNSDTPEQGSASQPSEVNISPLVHQQRSGDSAEQDPADPKPNPSYHSPSAGHENGQTATAEWGNAIYRVRFPGQTPQDGIFRPPFGWKYSFFLEEAVEEVPEYVVPWEAFRALTEDYNLHLMYRKPFPEVWKEEQDHPIFGPLSERMGVRERDRGPLLVKAEEMEAASFYQAFCFYKL